MSDRKFRIILNTIIVLGLLLTIAHAVYIYFAYQDSSIIQFIARESWS